MNFVYLFFLLSRTICDQSEFESVIDIDRLSRKKTNKVIFPDF